MGSSCIGRLGGRMLFVVFSSGGQKGRLDGLNVFQQARFKACNEYQS